MRKLLSLLLVSACLIGLAYAQTGKFQPGANPISNQSFDAATITVGTAFAQVSRAIYNGSSSACNFTATMNGGTSVVFQNNQSGTFNPIQATVITASTCDSGSLLVLY